MAVTLKGQSAIYEGTSADMKPSDADKNAIFQELDTGIDYYYDGTNWNEIPSSGGGGGGTGTDNYNELNNKPSINGTTLSGNKSLDNLGIQAKLTFDSAPTEDSENPVKSGGVYSALAGKQDTISDLSTIRSGAAAGATAVQPAAMSAALAAKQDTLSSAQLSAVNSGIDSTKVAQIETNKNNISAVTMGTQSTGDIDLNAVTTNSYKMYTNATSNLPTSDGSWYFVKTTVFDNNTMLQEATAMNAGAKTYTRIKRSGNWQAWKLSNLDSTQEAAVNSGIDSTKVAQIETNKNNILYNTNQGVKNLFNLTKVSGTYSTVVFTVNSDKTVTVNGTASPANSVFNLVDWTCTKAGTYVISGAPSGGSWASSPNTYRIRVAVNGTWKGDDVGNGFAITLAVGDVVNLQINTSTSYTANNLVFKPMICPKTIYDSDNSYQPYALSNAELTQSLLPTSYSLPTLIDDTTCTINEGGYVTVGNIVVINVTFTTTASYAAYGSIMQFPVPKNSGSITMVAAAHIDSSVNVAVNKYGQIALFDTPLPAGTYHFFTVYLKQ